MHGAWVALALALGILAVGCARPSGPVEIPEEEIPFSLARSPEPTTPEASTMGVTVFLVAEGRLAAVPREVSALSGLPEAAMLRLLEGPADDERRLGVTSRIPAQTRLLEIAVFDQVAEVDLSAEFQGPASPEDILLRVGQVVWTLVGLPGVTAVRFAIDGEPISVVTDGGVPVERPVTSPDYASIAPVPGTASPPVMEP